MGAFSSRLTRAAVALTILALAAAALLVLRQGSPDMHATAHFARTTGLYEGSEVRVLGVPVGRVESISPHGSTVRVEMTYDSQYAVPASAHAVIVSPSVVSDRFVQLTPGYQGGSQLADGATIPPARTRVPVELDQVYSTLNDMLVALGPQGANRHGSLARLLEVGADNLKGQGGEFNATLRRLAGLSQTLNAGRHDLFGTVRHLQGFTSELARNDAKVRAFNRTAAHVFDQLGEEGRLLRTTLHHLADALGRVEAFVRNNRDALSRNVAGLTDVTRTLVAEREALQEIIDTAPLGLNNLNNTFSVEAGGIRSRANQGETLGDTDGVLCQAVTANQAPDADQICRLLSALLEPGTGGARRGLPPLLEGGQR